MRGQKRKQVLGRGGGAWPFLVGGFHAAHRKLIINDRQQPSRAHRRDRHFTL